jgi:hypothetical protein
LLAFKVLRNDLTSLGLRAARHNRIQYRVGKWTVPREPIAKNGESGGLYVTPTLGDANTLRRYFEKKYGMKARIFSCKIGKVLKRTSCRIKTDKVRLLQEII